MSNSALLLTATNRPQSSTVYAIYILMVLTAANVLSYADRYLFSITIPAIKAEFGASDSLLGIVAGPGFTISYLLFTMPLASLADRWSRRKVLAISATLWSAATGFCGVATGMLPLTAARILVGVGEAGSMPASQSMISQLFGTRSRSTALGFLASAPYLGLVVGLSGGGAIASAWGWRSAFLLMAMAGIPIALLIWLTGPKRRGTSEAGGQADPKRGTAWTAIRHCWSIPSLRLLALGTGVFNIFGYASSIWLPTLLIRSHGMTAAEAGFWLGTCSTIGGVAGSFASGAVVDALTKRDQRWQLRLPALCFILAFPVFLFMLTMRPGLSLPLLSVNVPVIGLLLMLGGFLSSSWMGPSFGAVSHLISPEHRSQATALLIVIINVVGSAMGPVIAGLVSDALTGRFQADALRYSLLSMSLLTVLGGLIFLRAAAHYGRDISARSFATSN
jgi:MFS family permease